MGKEYFRHTITRGLIPVGEDLLFFDGFENLNNWTKSGSGGDEIFELDPHFAFSGKQSLYLKTRTTNAAENDFLYCDRPTFLPPTMIAKASFIWYGPTLATAKNISFSIAFYDGGVLHEATVFHYPASNKWFYYTTGPSEVEIPGSELDLSVNAWHRLQLAVDFFNSNYLYIRSDHKEHILTGIPTYKSTAVVESRLILRPKITTVGAAPTDLHLDQVFMTED
ncbi:hypothetical protein ES708_23631 [subsurface metagenome]